jgi:hypothetical protein
MFVKGEDDSLLELSTLVPQPPNFVQEIPDLD